MLSVLVNRLRSLRLWTFSFFFFKQKTAYEIFGVTGVQTCALPISPPSTSAVRPSPCLAMSVSSPAYVVPYQGNHRGLVRVAAPPTAPAPAVIAPEPPVLSRPSQPAPVSSNSSHALPKDCLDARQPGLADAIRGARSSGDGGPERAAPRVPPVAARDAPRHGRLCRPVPCRPGR